MSSTVSSTNNVFNSNNAQTSQPNQSSRFQGIKKIVTATKAFLKRTPQESLSHYPQKNYQAIQDTAVMSREIAKRMPVESL